MVNSLYSLAHPLTALPSSELLASGGIFDPDLFLWTLLVFGILLGLLYKFAWGPICVVLDEREETIRKSLETAELNAQRAEQGQQEYDAQIAEAAQTANKIVAGAKEEAEKAKARIVAQGNDEAKRLVDRGMSDIEAAKKAAVNRLAQASVDNAVGLAGKMIGKSLDKDSHAQLIRESLDKYASRS